MEKATILEKKWTYRDIECVVLFVRQSHRCGYMKIPKDSPFEELGYEDFPIEVHGGLTFKDKMSGEFKLDGEWLGFDCAHSGDVLTEINFDKNDHFWTTEEVAAETEKMVDKFKRLSWVDIVKYKMLYMPEWFKKRVRVD